jgi:hypothetical protein
MVMEAYIKAMNEDDDKDAVAQVCSSIVDVLKAVPFEAVQQCKNWQTLSVPNNEFSSLPLSIRSYLRKRHLPSFGRASHPKMIQFR